MEGPASSITTEIATTSWQATPLGSLFLMMRCTLAVREGSRADLPTTSPAGPESPQLRMRQDEPARSGFGRVEDGRGCLGPMANAPFPIPAHRTGRADFRHPALRLVSP